MKASPMRANKVTGMRNEVKIGSFGRRLLKRHKEHSNSVKGKGTELRISEKGKVTLPVF